MRIAALAVLPLFFPLAGRPVLLVGNSDGAAWKAELLMAAGATVHLVAPRDQLGDAIVRLLARSPSVGALRHRDGAWRKDDLDGMALAVADIATDADAADFRAAARRAGVPVNLVDKPAYCDFQFGSIVNRSPLVVGISTHGAAPILAQAVRRRVEAVLPPTLADWAALARRLRSLVNHHLPWGARRRLFWEEFSDRAFGPAPTRADEDGLRANVQGLAQAKRVSHASVTVIENGSDDPELLTLKAVRALQAADVVMFDAMASAGVLELARREARRISVAHQPELVDEERIAAELASLAEGGRRVVYVKAAAPTHVVRQKERDTESRASTP